MQKGTSCDRPHRSVAMRSYPSPKARGSDKSTRLQQRRSCGREALSAPEVRGGGGEELPPPEGRGHAQEEHPHLQGAAAAREQEG